MKSIVDGNEACAISAYFLSEISAIYPITPSSPMASKVDSLSLTNRKNLFNDKTLVIEMQSEAGAAGCMHGALQSGVLASSFTASQGLLLMIPNMYKMAGEMLPGVVHVASRTLATHALSIFGDHQDVYAARSTGFCFLASSSVHDAHYLGAISHLAAIKSSLPFLHFFDGFRTSHEINTIDILSDEDLLKLVDFKAIENFRKKAMVIGSNTTRGLAQNEDIYFQSMETKNKYYEKAADIVNEYMQRVNELKNSNYAPFVYYGCENPTEIIIAMGSVTNTIKETVDYLNGIGRNTGLIVVHLFRPFSVKYLRKVLPSSVQKIAVLDRAKEQGSVGEALYQDIVSSLNNTNIEIYGGRYGLSSKNTTPAEINAIYEMLITNPKHNFTIGINDDVTNLSLDSIPINILNDTRELLIYGFGSDGMVSASKDLLKIFGETKEKYVQGYFEYDSKKSGGVTISHLRLSDNKIEKPYYVTDAEIVVVTKDIYLNKFDCLTKIKAGGILLINTNKNEEEINEMFSSQLKKLLKEKNIKVLTVNAEKIALKYGIRGKINTIIETILLKLLKVGDYEEVIKNTLEIRFKTKGEEIVKANLNCVNEALVSLKEIAINLDYKEDDFSDKSIFDRINAREGNNLKVSELLPFKEGIFPGGLSKKEKRNVSSEISKWIKEKCIECGMCSFICPHAVVRPFILEKDIMPEELTKTCNTNKEKYFFLGISDKDCTGCGLCVKACPTEALVMEKNDNKNNSLTESLFDNYKNEIPENIFNIKNSQLIKPKFEFSGACAGCGETAYLKLLSQLFGESIIIANATGCSSIYSGSVPSTPYSIPWANSLFEDNAEFGLGIHLGGKIIKDRALKIFEDIKDAFDENIQKILKEYIENSNNFKKSREIKDKLDSLDLPEGLKYLLPYLPASNVWCIGGDGWAYDIGFGGIDHVLSSNENINILVLDTEVYSNTGGQASKASRTGQIAEFAESGKKTFKKDLFKIAMNYPNVYVASVVLGANGMQTIKAFKEAAEHNGPSIIIAYAPCVEHGIKGGLNCSLESQKLAVESGYALLMRYNPEGSILTIDSKEPNFEKYEEYLLNEVRYNALEIKDEKLASKLFNLNKENAKERYEYFKKVANKK